MEKLAAACARMQSVHNGMQLKAVMMAKDVAGELGMLAAELASAGIENQKMCQVLQEAKRDLEEVKRCLAKRTSELEEADMRLAQQTEEAFAADVKRSALEKDAVNQQLEFAAMIHLLSKERDDAVQHLHGLSEVQRESQSAICHLQERVEQERERGEQEAARRLSICRRAVKRMLMHNLVQSWSMFVDNVKDAKTRRARLKEVIGRMQHRGLAAAWFTLRSWVAEQVSNKVILSRAASRINNALVSKHFRTWIEEAREASRVKGTLRHAFLRIQNKRHAESFCAWSIRTADRMSKRRIVARATLRADKAVASRSLLTWRERAGEGMRRGRIQARAASCITHRFSSQILLGWREAVAYRARRGRIQARAASCITHRFSSQILLGWREAVAYRARIRATVSRAARKWNCGCIEDVWGEWLQALDARRRSALEHQQQECDTGQEQKSRAIARARDLASSLASPVATEVAADGQDPRLLPVVGFPSRRVTSKTADLTADLLQLRAKLREEEERSARLQEQLTDLADQHASETSVLRQELQQVLQDLEAEGRANSEAEILSKLRVEGAIEARHHAEAEQAEFVVAATEREEERDKMRDELERVKRELAQLQQLVQLQQHARSRVDASAAAADGRVQEVQALHAKLRSAEAAQDSLSNLLRLREDDLDSLNRTLALYAQGFAAATRASSDPSSYTSPNSSSSSYAPSPSEGEEWLGDQVEHTPAAGASLGGDHGVHADVKRHARKEARDVRSRQELQRQGSGATEQGRRGLEQLERLSRKLHARVAALTADKEQLLMRVASLERMLPAAPAVTGGSAPEDEEDAGSRAHGGVGVTAVQLQAVGDFVSGGAGGAAGARNRQAAEEKKDLVMGSLHAKCTSEHACCRCLATVYAS